MGMHCIRLAACTASHSELRLEPINCSFWGSLVQAKLSSAPSLTRARLCRANAGGGRSNGHGGVGRQGPRSAVQPKSKVELPAFLKDAVGRGGWGKSGMQWLWHPTNKGKAEAAVKQWPQEVP